MPKHYIQAPVGGIKRQLGYQSQEPFTSVESINMMPFDPITGRKASATRPPIGAFPDPGGVVNMLARVNGDASQSPQTSMVAASDGALYYWNGASWSAADMGMSPTLAVDENRAVYATTFLKQVFILNDGQTNEALVFDYEDNSVAVATASEGTFPSGCRIGATWQGGIWLAGDETEPHVFSGSRTGDPLDWNFSAPITDTGGAFTATGEAFGLIGDPITSMIPLSGDVLIIGCENSIWALKGHPRRGGTLEQVSSTIGILGQGAWAKGPDGKVYFLSHAGMCVMDPGGNAVAPISRDYVPDELFLDSYDYYDPKAVMAYDPRFNGIHLTVRGDEEQAWWFDIDTSGFHQHAYAAYPYVMLHFPPVEAEGQSGVLFGFDDNSDTLTYGSIGRYDNTAVETFDYRVLVGPMKMSAHLSEQGRIQFAQHVLSGGTTEDNISMKINFWVGATNEDVYNRYLTDDLSCKFEFSVQTMIPNGGRVQPRGAGASMMIEVFGKSTEFAPSRIVYEGTEIEVIPAGRSRRLPGRVGGVFDPAADFNASRWSTFAYATPPNTSVNMEDMPYYLDMSELPAAIFTAAHSTGRDLRAVTSTNRVLAMDLVDFNKSANTGFAVIKDTARTTAEQIRIYAGNPRAYAPGAASKIGAYSAYSDAVRAFYPSGSGIDRTIGARHLTAPVLTGAEPFTIDYASPTSGADAIGVLSSRYVVPTPPSGGAAGVCVANLSTGLSSDFGDYDSLPGSVTISAFVRPNTYWTGVGTPTNVPIISVGSSAFDGSIDMSTQQAGVSLSFAQEEAGAASDLVLAAEYSAWDAANGTLLNAPVLGFSAADSGSRATSELATGSFAHIGGVLSSIYNSTDRVYTNGTAGAEASETGGDPTGIVDLRGFIFLGGQCVVDGASPQAGASYDLSHVMILDEAKPAAFLAYHASMLNQTTFWGGWTEG